MRERKGRRDGEKGMEREEKGEEVVFTSELVSLSLESIDLI